MHNYYVTQWVLHRDKCAVCALKERGLGHVARLCSVEMPASIHMRATTGT